MREMWCDTLPSRRALHRRRWKRRRLQGRVRLADPITRHSFNFVLCRERGPKGTSTFEKRRGRTRAEKGGKATGETTQSRRETSQIQRYKNIEWIRISQKNCSESTKNTERQPSTTSPSDTHTNNSINSSCKTLVTVFIVLLVALVVAAVRHYYAFEIHLKLSQLHKTMTQ